MLHVTMNLADTDAFATEDLKETDSYIAKVRRIFAASLIAALLQPIAAVDDLCQPMVLAELDLHLIWQANWLKCSVHSFSEVYSL